MATADQSEFEALLEYLQRTRGFDFGSYKPTSLSRRVRKRMETVGVESYADYTDYLEVHPDEFAHLFNTILINVTSFFRDPPSWEYLAAEVIPRLLAQKSPGAPIRVWSAGCASGEEAYTAAMVLEEALGPAEFRARVKIYATDVSEGALNKARQATYSPREVESVPPALLAKHFRLAESCYIFDPELRRSVVFGRHDLVQDSPISRIDLLICRNTLMYFNSEAQSRILARFAFGLSPGGLLFLGKAEMLLSATDLFAPIDLKRRVFTKVGRPGGQTLSAARPNIAAEATDPPALPDGALREAALNTSTLAQILVDNTQTVSMINDQARALLGLSSQDIGRPLHELTVSYRPVDVRAALDEAFAQRRTVVSEAVPWPGSGGPGGGGGAAGRPRWFDVAVAPLLGSRGEPLGASITYLESTGVHRLRDELQQVSQDRETTQEELQTTNEELQSTVEELETTNEELHSTNEELETMNEELQSTNEELRTSNEELHNRGSELASMSGYWQSVLGSLQTGMIVLDRDFKVEVWTPKCEDLWGLRSQEAVGKHFLNLDIGLGVDRLKQPIRACMSGESAAFQTVVDATNRRGKPFSCRVACMPLMDHSPEVRGAILLMEELPAERTDA
jgi:two-component system CheB/CheR fusion protein